MKLGTQLLLAVGICLNSPLVLAKTNRLCVEPWKGSLEANDCRMLDFNLMTTQTILGIEYQKEIQAQIRSGYLEESSNVPFRGNIIYYQGLGDSMQNHFPLFSKLTQAGYRVIAFDYLGQGGSTGSMNDTRIDQIGRIGNMIWKIYARDLNQFPKKTIIGWSTGGLAAYVQAARNSSEDVVDRVDNIALLAPGIVPNTIVGEQNLLKLQINKITLNSLTTQSYPQGSYDPHVDRIHPNSPLKVPSFAINLLATALKSQKMKMDPTVKGFVLLSGDEDNYVNADETKDVISKNTLKESFKVKKYEGTLHEIDNEAEPMGSQSHIDIINFIKENT